jgi:hypothetical protein
MSDPAHVLKSLHAGEVPASVLAAGPQLATAGLVSVPPQFGARATRTCDAWEDEGEEELEGQHGQQQVLIHRQRGQQDRQHGEQQQALNHRQQ